MRIKPLLPTLRERKRYVGFSVKGDQGNLVVVDQTFQDALIASFTRLFGAFALAQSGLQFVVSPKIPQESSIIRVQHTYLDHLRAAFVELQDVRSLPIQVYSVVASGMLHRVEKALLAKAKC